MKALKRVLSVLLASVFILTFLTACSPSDIIDRFAPYEKVYDGAKAAQWSLDHAHDHPSASKSGEYCADFVSLALKAGGFESFRQTSSCRTLYSQLKESPYTDYFTENVLEYSGDKILATGANAGKVAVGDIILYHNSSDSNYKHAAMVVSIDGNGVITVAQWNSTRHSSTAADDRCLTYWSKYPNCEAICFHFSDPDEQARQDALNELDKQWKDQFKS